MIIDAFTQVGTSIHGYGLEPENLLNSMDVHGIDMSVICPVQPYEYRLEPGNEYIAELAQVHPRRLIGFGRVDPRLGDRAIAEVDRIADELGLRGLFLHPWEEGYPVNREFVVRVANRAADKKLPVLVAAGYPWVSHALQVADLAGKAPRTTFIMTHGGQINISGLAQADAYMALKKHDNLLMETSGVYRQDFIEDVITGLGAHRVLFGSNSPRMHQGFELDRAVSATKSYESAQADVLGNNVAALLNLA